MSEMGGLASIVHDAHPGGENSVSGSNSRQEELTVGSVEPWTELRLSPNSAELLFVSQRKHFERMIMLSMTILKELLEPSNFQIPVRCLRPISHISGIEDSIRTR